MQVRNSLSTRLCTAETQIYVGCFPTGRPLLKLQIILPFTTLLLLASLSLSLSPSLSLSLSLSTLSNIDSFKCKILQNCNFFSFCFSSSFSSYLSSKFRAFFHRRLVISFFFFFEENSIPIFHFCSHGLAKFRPRCILFFHQSRFITSRLTPDRRPNECPNKA